MIGLDPASWPAWQVRRAVRSWGEWVDARLEATEPEPVKALPSLPKGKAWGQRPRYRTVYDAMGMPKRAPETGEARLAKEADRLAAELERRGAAVDWERPETWELDGFGTTPEGGYPA